MAAATFDPVSNDDWQAGLARTVATEVRRYRQLRGMTVKELAEKAERWGASLAPAVLYKFEQHKRPTVSVAEWFALSAALRVPPALLLFPMGRQERMEVLPDVHAEPIDGLGWLMGDYRTLHGSPLPHADVDEAAIAAQAREHDVQVEKLMLTLDRIGFLFEMLHADPDLTEASRETFRAEMRYREQERAEIVGKIRALRERMRSLDLVPQQLPDQMAGLFTQPAPEATP